MRPDTCSFCKGRLHPKETEFLARVNDEIIVVKNVPALVCENCEEAYFSSQASRQIDMVMKQFQKGEISVKSLSAVEINLKTFSQAETC